MTGGCLCGAVRYESTGEPGFALLCHCRDCQRQSGSAFAAGWRVPAAGFRVTQGEPKLYVRAADSGRRARKRMAPPRRRRPDGNRRLNPPGLWSGRFFVPDRTFAPLPVTD